MKKALISMGVLLALLGSCTTPSQPNLTLSGLDPARFEKMIDNNQPVKLYTLKNKNGMEVCITNFGARIVSIMVPDKNGKMTDVVLGFDNIEDYINVPSDFGATIGRYANRIGQGKITIDGKEIQLPQNNYGHCLHGGPTGWQYKVFKANQNDEKTIKLTVESPDGDNNFPGNVIASVTYTLTENNAIDIQYEATTDKKTVINMTNHSYFNLNGNPSVGSMNQILYLAADSITPVDDTFMTTGEMMAVAGTPFDFNTPKAIEQDVTNFDNEQIKFGKGFDHNWVLKTKGDIKQVAAKLTSPITGITLEVYTDEPGVQLYTGNFLDGTVKGKNGIVYPQRASVCLETQHYPDSPNKAHWPSVVLEPGKTYTSHCIFQFGVVK
ncbi:MAG: galactose mutarotase [Bacteroides sp.]|nr:galactose mutarotase [Bacteroides sp.]